MAPISLSGDTHAASYGIARVELFDSMATAEPVWRRLEAASDSLMSPYQRFDFVSCWQRHVGVRKGLTPLIAVGFDPQGATVTLWPLGVRTSRGVRTAEFLGGKHANFNMMIWQTDLAPRADAAIIDVMLRSLAARADALVLLNQPRAWEGIANPLTRLPHTDSADPAYSGALMPDFEALLLARMSANKRKKVRNRERALAHHGDVTFRRAQSSDDARAILATFHAQKAQRMRELGVGNVFEEPGVADFIADAATTQNDNGPVIEVYALAAGGQIVATSAGVVARGRFSTMFNSIIRNELAQASPGQLLLMRLVQNVCERGLTTFDLGVGDAQYKEIFCADQELLFDSFIPLSNAGQLWCAMTRLGYAGKRTIKRNPALWSAVQTLRGLRARMSR